MDKDPENPRFDERSDGGTSPGPGPGPGPGPRPAAAAAAETGGEGGEGGVAWRTDDVLAFDGLLFDMDGTLVDSTKAIVKHWQKIAVELNVDPNVILATSHGRRSIDTLKIYDPAKANWEYVSQIEGCIPTDFGADADEIAGAHELLRRCQELRVPWAIVTSGTRALVEGWLKVLDLAHPEHLVVAEDVERGKPDPACYNLARARLGLARDAPVLVLEDSPAGVQAGKAAGASVVALTTTHDASRVKEAGADWIVPDLRRVTLLSERHAQTGRVQVRIQV